MPFKPNLRPLENQATDANRGNGVVLRRPGSSGKSDRPVLARVVSECVRGERLAVTMQAWEAAGCWKGVCSPPECEDRGLFALPAIRGHLEWCLGAASFYALFDVLEGTVVSIVADSAKLCAEYVIWGDACATWLPDFRVNGGIGYGGSAPCCAAQLTELVCVEAGGKSCVEIPPFATAVVLQLVSGPRPTRVSVMGPRGGPKFYPKACDELFILFNGAEYVCVDNTEGTSPLAAFVIFKLAL